MSKQKSNDRQHTRQHTGQHTGQPQEPVMPAGPQPRFLVKDPAGVYVDLDGNDCGPAERRGKGDLLDADLMSGGGRGARLGEVIETQAMIEHKLQRVYKAQDALDIMLRNQSITEAEHESGKRFKFYYDLSGAYHITAASFEKSGGMVSREDFLTAQINATRRVEDIINHLGGPETVAARALVNVIGKGASFDFMFQVTGMTKHFWRGGVVSALGSLVGYFKNGGKKTVSMQKGS